jgi:predicted NBD/HSP70 family sugar kinase
MVASSRAAIRVYNAASERKLEDIQELLQLCKDGDPDAVHALTEQARALGRGLRLITATLSPELILVVGDITAAWERCGPIVAQELAASMLADSPPLLRAAGDAELARLSGSAAMLMQRHASYHRSTHEKTSVSHNKTYRRSPGHKAVGKGTRASNKIAITNGRSGLPQSHS